MINLTVWTWQIFNDSNESQKHDIRCALAEIEQNIKQIVRISDINRHFN